MFGYTQQFEKMANAQKEFLEPMRRMGEFSVDTFEKYAKQNYQVAGDFVDFTVEHMRASTAAQTPAGFVEQQVAATQALADFTGRRASEYSTLAREVFTESQDVFKSNVMEPAQRAGEKYAEAAKEFQTEMKETIQSASASMKNSAESFSKED